jgi:hypothetical protein
MATRQKKIIIEMNCLSIRKYFASKYYSKFDKDYPDDKLMLELVLLKKLLKSYSPYTILEAIDLFMKYATIDVAKIIYFSSSRVFGSKFKNLVKINDIIKYKRFLPFYEEDKEEASKLLHEYSSYASAISLSQEDLARKEEILRILEEIDAKRFRRESNIVTQGQPLF